MKKNIFIVLLITILIVLIIGTMYTIDRIKMKNNQPVVFSTWGYDYAPPESTNNSEENNQQTDNIILNNYNITKLVSYDVKAREIDNDIDELQKLDYPDTMALSKVLALYVRSDIRQEDYNDLHDIKLFYEGQDKSFCISMSMLAEPLTDYKDAIYENNFKKSVIGRNEVVFLHNENIDSVNQKVFYTCIFKYAGVHFVVETTNLTQEEVVDLIKSIFKCDMKSIIKQKADEKFQIIFEPRNDLEIKTIVSKEENGFDIYSYAGDVRIRIGDEEYDLREAILSNNIRMEEIIKKAESDTNNGKILECLVSGGSNSIYKYKTYAIMDYKPMDGDRAVYIGIPEMKLSSIK